CFGKRPGQGCCEVSFSPIADVGLRPASIHLLTFSGSSRREGPSEAEKSLPKLGWASLLSCWCLQYALIGSDGSLFMNVTANIGTVAYAGVARSWGAAALACMGVVFGDIGTSPLYALSAAAKAVSPGGDVSPQAVLGIVSLIFWSLIIVISIKY